MSEHTRAFIVLSLLAYIAAVVPVWWGTVRVQRADLPIEPMLQAASLHGSFHLPVRVALYALCKEAAACQGAQAGMAEAVKAELGGYLTQGVALKIIYELPNGTCMQQQQQGTDLPHTSAADPASAYSSSSSSSSSSTGPAESVCLGLTQLPSFQQEQEHAAHAQDSSSLSSSADMDIILQGVLQQKLGPSQAGHYHVFILPAAAADDTFTASSSSGSSSNNASLAVRAVVGIHRHAWVQYPSAEDVSTAVHHAAHIAKTAFLARTAASPSTPPLPVSPNSELVLSFSLANAQPHTHALTWDFPSFQQRYLAPLVRALSPILQARVQGQVLQYTPARTHGAWSQQHASWLLSQRDLPYFIDSDWNLDSGRLAAEQPMGSREAKAGSSGAASSEQAVAQGAPDPPSTAHIPPHVLHFVLYVPPGQYTPLLIQPDQDLTADTGSSTTELKDSFWVPSWGGLTIHTAPITHGSASRNESPQESIMSNSSSSSRRRLVSVQAAPEQLQRFAAVVAEQLHALLGCDMHTRLEQGERVSMAGKAWGSHSGRSTRVVPVKVLPALRSGFRAWEVDALMRQHASHAMATAAQTLGSLARLVEQLSNLAIPEDVRLHALASLDSMQAAQEHLLKAQAQRVCASSASASDGMEAACGVAATGRGLYESAVVAAAAAHAHAEAAFSHHAIAQQNVPDSHYVGVYLPFFLPASVPLLQGVVQEVLHYAKHISYSGMQQV